MNTQNVKIAAPESSERWNEEDQCVSETLEPWERPGVKHPDAVRLMEKQFEYMDDLKDLFACYSTTEEGLEQALYEIFMRMTEQAAYWGADYKQLDKPKVDYEMVKYWVRAMRFAHEHFGKIGERAWEHARYRFAISLAIEYSYN